MNDSREAFPAVFSALQKCSDGLGTNLPDRALETISEDLIDKYKYDSIEDIILCLKRGRQGYYGNNYGKLNLIVISDWMSYHLEEKAKARENYLNASKKQELTDEEFYSDYIEKMNEPTDEQNRASQAMKVIVDSHRVISKHSK